MAGTIRECFVYIQLPGSLETVTCGKFGIERTRTGGTIGHFVYGRSYRERRDAVAIDPIHLPLSPTEYRTTKLNGVFGALRDAAPDAWGRRVIDRVTGRHDLDELDYLLQSAEDGAGALSFGRNQVPPAPARHFNRVVQLGELRGAAASIETGDPSRKVPKQIRDLLEPGTSLGGARPKNIVEDKSALWIAKFPQQGDRWNNAAVEAAMLALASRCSIRVPRFRVESVGNESVLLVERFDRKFVRKNGKSGYARHRMVSALTVLDADDSATDRANWSYLTLADEIQRWSNRPKPDKQELFRRIVFNALIANVDDHPRNHALIAPGLNWFFAPAYDLTPNSRQGVEDRRLAMDCGRYGRIARRDNILSDCERFFLSKESANSIIDEMAATIGKHWRQEVLRHGGTEADCAIIATAFDYPGFEYTTSSDSY
jgi:serine/threonine-protein kinase HipA